MIDETLFEAEEKMERAIEFAKEEFGAIRTGRATPGMFARIDHRLLRLPDAAAADGLDRHPGAPDGADQAARPVAAQGDGEGDPRLRPRASTPTTRAPRSGCSSRQMTEERRRDMIKVVRHKGEDAKVAIRNVRRKAKEELDRIVKDGEAGEDDGPPGGEGARRPDPPVRRPRRRAPQAQGSRAARGLMSYLDESEYDDRGGRRGRRAPAARRDAADRRHRPGPTTSGRRPTAAPRDPPTRPGRGRAARTAPPDDAAVDGPGAGGDYPPAPYPAVAVPPGLVPARAVPTWRAAARTRPSRRPGIRRRGTRRRPPRTSVPVLASTPEPDSSSPLHVPAVARVVGRAGSHDDLVRLRRFARATPPSGPTRGGLRPGPRPRIATAPEPEPAHAPGRAQPAGRDRGRRRPRRASRPRRCSSGGRRSSAWSRSRSASASGSWCGRSGPAGSTRR